MIFWLILALMTGAAVLAVIWPLALTGKDGRSGSDVEVYRDQLNELFGTKVEEHHHHHHNNGWWWKGPVCQPQPSTGIGTGDPMPERAKVWCHAGSHHTATIEC